MEDDRPGEQTSDGASSVWTWLLPALAFVAGVALGGVVVAVGASGDDAGLLARDDVSSPPTPPPVDDERQDVLVRVPAACLEAADAAEQALRLVDDAVAAVRRLDARRVQELVDEGSRLAPVVRVPVEECRELAGDQLQDGTLITPAPGATR